MIIGLGYAIPNMSTETQRPLTQIAIHSFRRLGPNWEVGLFLRMLHNWFNAKHDSDLQWGILVQAYIKLWGIF